MGIGLIETHKTLPASKVELAGDLQSEVNEFANQRLDNVKLTMNGRVLIRRGGDVDLQSLMRSTPGGAIPVNDVEKDVKFDRPPDVTAAGYQEQDRLNVDFDEISGAFSPGTIQTNRRLNETVGGMQLLAGTSNAIGEYDLRVFSETWVEEVMRQMVALEQYYETDETVLSLAASKAQLFQRFGVSEVTDDLLRQHLTVSVNVGIGATDPMQRMAKLRAAAETTGIILGPMLQQIVKPEEIIAEVFGAAGYKDGKRFFALGPDGKPEQDPKLAQAMQIIQQLQGEAKSKDDEITAKFRLEQMQIEANERIKIAEIAAHKEITLAKARIDGAAKIEAAGMVGATKNADPGSDDKVVQTVLRAFEQQFGPVLKQLQQQAQAPAKAPGTRKIQTIHRPGKEPMVVTTDEQA
jgi:hypothetical protein